MKIKILTFFLLFSCGSKKEGVSASCGLPSGIYQGTAKQVSISGCSFQFQSSGGCMMTGTYNALAGSLHVDIDNYTSACGVSSNEMNCSYSMNSSSSFHLTCPQYGISDNFARDL